MDVADHVRARQAEQFVVALHVLVKVLEALAPVLGFIELEALDHGAHRAIENQDALRQKGGELRGTGVGERVHGRYCRKSGGGALL